MRKKAEIREQIEYDILCQQYDRMQLDELVEIMLEVAMNRSPTVKIGRDAEYPTGFVQQRFEKITSINIPPFQHLGGVGAQQLCCWICRRFAPDNTQ